MQRGELALVEWLKQRQRGGDARIEVGIGDDMGVVRVGGGRVLITSDMLLDGVHFELHAHGPERVGRKAIACSLSDCAAMAVRPVAAVVSVALPRETDMAFAQSLFEGMRRVADEFDLAIVGGDTTAWSGGLAVDVAMLGEAWPDCEPVRRDGARSGDELYVTGLLGGSLAGRHLDFVPRVAEAHQLATSLGTQLHAMMDLSDGLGLDLRRMCDASGCGAVLDERMLADRASDAAREAAAGDGRSVLDHVLRDGEDFELLFAVDPTGLVPPLGTHVGTMTDAGLHIVGLDGMSRPLEATGFEHFT